jgi:hypothetical protein
MITTNQTERWTNPGENTPDAGIILFSRASVIIFAATLIGEVLLAALRWF